MRASRFIAPSLALTLGLLGLGCSEDPVQPPAPARPPSAAGPKFALAEETSDPAAEAAYRYDPTNKRDPFKSFVRSEISDGLDAGPLERFDLTQLSVTGIVWGTDGPRALIKDPAGKGHIVSVGSIMGKNKGRIVEIEDNVVKVKETYVDALNRAATKNVELRLRETQGG